MDQDKTLKCKHVRSNFVVPGWGCCKCHIYNGYQRDVCRGCGHPPCYETTSVEGKEALELKPIGDNPDLVGEWLSRSEKNVPRSLTRS